MRQWMTKLLVIMLPAMLCLGGCETETQNKALWGTAIGAGIGQAVGGDTKATVIGAGIGAGVGAAVGYSEDVQADRPGRPTPPPRGHAPRPDANVLTVWIVNSNGSKTPVQLTRRPDGGYIGPKGEFYDRMPTVEQLKQAYGF